MSRASRAAARARAEAQKAARKAARDARARDVAQAPVPTRTGKPRFIKLIEHRDHPQYDQHRRAALNALLGRSPSDKRLARFTELALRIDRRKRGLYEHPDWWRPLWVLAALPWTEGVPATYTPQGRAFKRRVHGLIDHLLVRWPVPRFLFNAFHVEGEDWVLLFTHMAQGGSLRDAPLHQVLTKRARKAFPTAPATLTPLQAIRWSQTVAEGGTPSQAMAMAHSPLGLRSLGFEAAVPSVIGWFVRSEVSGVQLDELVAYVLRCQARDREFSLKGRTAASLLRRMEDERLDDMRERQLAGLRQTLREELPRPRFRPVALEGGFRVEPILTLGALAREGHRMQHCVLSYAQGAAQGQLSIWRLRCGAESRVTLELRHADRCIVQARGKNNRPPTPQERAMVGHWASANGLGVQAGIWR